ncbi:MAG TPA: pyridoxamine 5'-phosphate oxidase family protein [Kofleriaceae bacterium]|jgi:predicted pyridoxine 5'-phosphate oxidase superfamily flavin-nucleotide-binding protein|nr:pyridoxamine 5'-phosphate oxidase family protein [Kofleriaceae bacterium]
MGILTKEAKQALVDCTPAYVATVCPDGTPNVSPKGTVMAWDDDRLVFIDLRSPQTMANLQASPHIELNVIHPLTRKGFRYKGTAQVLRDGPLCEEVMTYYEQQRGIHRARMHGVVVMVVTRVLPLWSPAYDDGTGEDEIRAKWCARFQTMIDAARPR